MIIDSHVHIAGPPLNQEYIRCNIADGSVITLPFKRVDCSVNHLLQAMDAYNIDVACVNAFSGAVNNEFLSKVLEEHQKRFIGFAWIDKPLVEEEAVEELHDAVTTLGFKGLKLHPGVQEFYYKKIFRTSIRRNKKRGRRRSKIRKKIISSDSS